MKIDKNTDSLIAKVLSGNATSGERNKLDEWKESSGENAALIKQSEKIWNSSSSFISEQTLQRDRLELETQYNRYLAKSIRKIRTRSAFYKIAALIAFPIALALGWNFLRSELTAPEATTQICEVISPKGHISKTILPDGSAVWINTASLIRYDINSFNSKNREVVLEGEAYFEVNSSPGNTFTVITPHANVNVTGTSFNVNAYPASDAIETVLTEGKIELEFKTGNTLNVEPSQKVRYSSTNDTYEVSQVDAEMYSSWRNGEIIFKDATLNDLIRELERIYDITFHIQPASLGDLRFRGMFSYNNNLIEALEKIKKSSDADYLIENKKVLLKKSQLKN